MLAHIERLMEAETIEQIWDLHTARMADYGFDRMIYGFTRFRTSNSFGSPDDLLVLSNHDAEYVRGFMAQGMYTDAPMVRWAAECEGSASWRLVAERRARGALTPGEERVLAFNLAHGVRAGYSISFRDISPRAKGAIGLCARQGLDQDAVDQIWDRHGREIEVQNGIAHLRITSMPYATSRRALSPRQRETLEWVGEGKTTADIAQIMGLTAATVEKHLRLAREALDVETTAQAVLKAAYQNQIFVTLR